MTALSPANTAICHRVLERISGPNWTLEWSLPYWLGLTFGLTPAASQELVLSNVYGLAYVRLYDDLLDDEVDELLTEGSTPLLGSLYHLWDLTYDWLFGPPPRFWSYFARYMTQWRESHRPPFDSRHSPRTITCISVIGARH